MQSETSPNDPPSPSPREGSSPLTPSRGSRYTNLRKARFVPPPFHLSFKSVSSPFPAAPPTDTYSNVINIGLPPSEGEGLKIVLQAIEQFGRTHVMLLRQLCLHSRFYWGKILALQSHDRRAYNFNMNLFYFLTYY